MMKKLIKMDEKDKDKKIKDLEKQIQDFQETIYVPSLTEEDIARSIAKCHDCYEVEQELEKLEEENKRLKKELEDIEEARGFKVEIPDSWIIEDDKNE